MSDKEERVCETKLKTFSNYRINLVIIITCCDQVKLMVDVDILIPLGKSRTALLYFVKYLHADQ